MKTINLCVFAAAIALFGCSAVVQTVAFNPDDFKAYEVPGSASIHGHAFIRTDDGRKENAAGLNVFLAPLTPYTDERANIMIAQNTPPAPDPRLANYVRVVLGDVSGAYAFDGLPAGSYVVYCRIEWWRRRLGRSGDYFAIGKVTIADGEKKHLVVTNANDQP